MLPKKRNPRVGVTNEFRYFLAKTLEEKRKRNPSYSLRAFAKNLEIHHTFLSRIMSGSRSISKASQQKFLRILKLTPQEAEKYFAQNSGSSTELKLEQLELDTFIAVSDWFHDAILELTRLKLFKPDVKWISAILDVPEAKIKKAIDRLIRLNLLKIGPDEIWKDVSGDNTNVVEGPFTNQALKNYQKQVLDLASKAIDRFPKTKRDNTSVMMVINSKDLPEARKYIQKFRRDLTQFLDKSNRNADQLYQLGIAFYPVAEI